MENNSIKSTKLEKKKSISPVFIIIAVAIITIVAVISVFIAKGQNENKYNDSIALAQRFLDEGDYERAIAAFEEVISINPKSVDAYIGLADAYITRGDEELAKSNYEKAINDYDKALEWLEEGADNTSSDEIDKCIKDIKDKIDDTREEMDDDSEIGSVTNIPSFESEILTAPVGSIVLFGSYEQDNNTANGAEPIEWYVLENNGKEVTLLSVYIIDAKEYNINNSGELDPEIPWEISSLRSWLNSDFYDIAFNSEQQSIIKTSVVVNSNHPFWGTSGGNNTNDKVYLLSYNEIEKYFRVSIMSYYNRTDYNDCNFVDYCWNTDNRIFAQCTPYAIANGALCSDGNVQDYYSNSMYADYYVGCGMWWLRSPGAYNEHAGCIFDLGFGDIFSGNDNWDYVGVRPTIKIGY